MTKNERQCEVRAAPAAPVSSGRARALHRVERALGHRFVRRALLAEALRHRSAAHEQGAPSSERLEFLGDAALSHAVAALLFARWPQVSEGELTRARAALVRKATLARLAQEIGVGKALDLGSNLEAAEAGPSVLADALEALLGALLLDAGWRRFQVTVRRLFVPLAERLDPAQLILAEPKTALQQLAQQRGFALPAYRHVEVRGPAHRQVFVVEVEFGGVALARGEGSSKRAAQQDAALHALRVLDITP
jgi:ribonuclease-3